MNRKRILIADPDNETCLQLRAALERTQMGDVVAMVTDGARVLDEIMFCRPDLVLLEEDFSPLDGVAIVASALSRGSGSHFVMMARTREAAERAYGMGIDFFLSKPVCIPELYRVVENVSRSLDMERALAAVRQAVLPQTPSAAADDGQQRLREIFSDIGITGVTGSREIAMGVDYLRSCACAAQEYRLSDVYRHVGMALYGGDGDATRQKGIEQKIRRAIQKAQDHLAARGNEDYYDDIFTEYAPSLFEFRQIQQQMRWLQGKTEQPGKINTRRFFEGILLKLEE